ncbi:hypothetical protein Pla123a_21620 [Posidoniimonas polymericola]|uniref:VWFA domain-containing protein n=1 Tax=Posidoniimonas polymericola TaxID=2528002 RepID=A0A5C5YRD3_9BACT|nr:BatA domain-containing protein [Posidoniimonas polymericola]TWT77501.1 hypothetical protein Pla123a_21620 [Posidoniimonas polymericola]
MIPLPLAFGFANLAILGWLGAAAAPILIHLWMKRVRKETRWAAVRFLQAAIKRHARRLQLQQWILLAIRTAIILLVVLAAAKPTLDSLGLVGPGVRTHRMLVVDASLSMGLETDAGKLITQAKRLAGQLIDQSREGDVFSVATLAAPPRAVLAQPTSDRSRAKRSVEQVELTEGTADLGRGLQLVRQLLTDAEAAASNVDRHEITFFTDLTAATWGPLAGDAPAGDPSDAEAESAATGQAAQLYAKLIEDAVLTVVDVGQPDAENTAVVETRLETSTPTTQRPLAVRAKIARFGGEKDSGSEEQLVDLVVDGVAVASQTARFSAGQTASVSFSHQIRTPGEHTLSVRLAEDRLVADNQRWLACRVEDNVRVLCVEGRRGAAMYVASALNPTGDNDSPIQPEVVSDAELAAIDLADYRCVFFCNVAQLSRNEAQRLESYVRGGGGAVFFLGDRVDADRYNDLLGPPAAATRTVTPVVFKPGDEQDGGLLPAEIGRPVSSPQFRLDPLEYTHPIVAPFRGRERAGLITTPVSRFYQLILPNDAASQTALATTGGDPLLVTSEFGRGRVVLFATDGSLTSVDPSTGEPWTAMPAWPSFLPIVRELLSFASTGGGGPPAVTVGEAIGGPAPEWAAGSELAVIRPDGQQETTLVSAVRGAWSYDRTDRAGVYVVRAEDRPGTLAAAAVNPDPRESDLARTPSAALPAELRLRNSPTTDSGEAANLAPATGVHRGLLMAALLLVLLETFLAYWFGRSAG